MDELYVIIGEKKSNLYRGRNESMKIIDAHLHFFPASEQFAASAVRAGHAAELAHVEAMFRQNGIVLGIVMGTADMGETEGGPLTLPFPEEARPPFFAQCLGIAAERITVQNQRKALDAFEEKLRDTGTVGLKVYAGYRHFYVDDPVYHPFYELAEAYDVPVVIHTGDTANAQGKLKYSHPLTVDAVAVDFPRVKFVMAHYGNPWLVDATEVAKKNPNVYIDLSGLAEGVFSVDTFMETYRGYLDILRTWMTYLGRYDKLLYGSDWPLVNVPSYIELIGRLVPERHHAAVFYENATRVFQRIEALTALR